jgi:heme-degrading monooxygenase HmoA
VSVSFARIGGWQGSSEKLDRWVETARGRVKPNVSQQPGLEAAYWLIDRESGQGLTLTIWNSKDAMEASEQFRQQSQASTSDATGARVTTERFEVVDHL